MLGAVWMSCLFVLIYCQHIRGQVQVQLERGGVNDGLLKIYYNNAWTIGCSNSQAFTRSDANILCRGLGKLSGKSVLMDYKYYLVGNETLETVETVMFEFQCQGTEASFDQCVIESSLNPTSEDPCINAIGVLCSDQDPTFQFSSTISNRIEMRVNNTWAGICADKFTYKEAVVACKTLEKPWTDARPLKIRNKLSTEPVVRHVTCFGDEPLFANCSGFMYGYRDCPESRDAGVFCGNANEYQFRLMDGPSLSIGRIEMWHRKQWGTVCSRSHFTRTSAQVVCKALGLQYSSARVVSIEDYYTTKGVIWLKDANCTGSEENLRQCDHHFNGAPVPSPCTHQDDVAISCESHRLEGSSEESGKVQVSYEGTWFNVIGDSFDKKAATVVCRSLNKHRSGADFTTIAAPASQTDDMLEIKSCVPSMRSLMDCHKEWVDPVSLSEDNIQVTQVQVTCKTADSSLVKFRHPGNDMLGLYEVYNGTDWGTICSTGLGEEEVRVACRHLGYGSSFAAIFPPKIKGNGSVILDGITCQGSENSFTQCNYNPFGVVSCDKSHRDDLIIYCGNVEDNFDVRLVGDRDNAGRVEVKLYGSWGTVCDDGFDFNAAKVICRQLNLPMAEPRTTSIFPSGSEDMKVWLHGVNCTGEEDTIQDCKFNPILGTKTCTHAEDIGVVCSGTVVPVSDGLSGGAIAGIVIAILIIFAILIVALCVGIRKWSAARRDLGSNLLKTDPKTTKGNVQYSNEDGLVNMAFDESPNVSNDRLQNGTAYNEPAKVPHVAMGSYEPYKARHLSQTPDLYANTKHADSNGDIPPAYHTLDTQSVPSYDKPPSSSVSSHGDTQRSAQPGPAVTRPYNPPSPSYRDPSERPQSQSYLRDDTEDDFGFSSNGRSPGGKGYAPPNRSYNNDGNSRIAGRQTRPHYSTTAATPSGQYHPDSNDKGVDNSGYDRQQYREEPSGRLSSSDRENQDYDKPGRTNYSNTGLYNDPRNNPRDPPSADYRKPPSTYKSEPSPPQAEDVTFDSGDLPEGTSV